MRAQATVRARARHHTVNYYENEQIGGLQATARAPPHCGREKAENVQPSDTESFPAEQGLALLVAPAAKPQGAAAKHAEGTTQQCAVQGARLAHAHRHTRVSKA